MHEDKKGNCHVVLIIFFMVMLFLTILGGEKAKGSREGEIVLGCVWMAPVGDMGWTYAHDLGRQFVEKEIPDVKSIVQESVSVADAPAVIDTMIEEGADIIIANAIQYQDVCIQKGKQYADKYFVYVAGRETGRNVATIFGAMYQPTYLTGLMAGALTKTGKIGFVGAMPLPQVIRRINAMTIGAREVNPAAEVHVIYTNNWYDPPTERDVAITLIGLGCDVLAQHQDSPATVEAANGKGVFCFGFDADMTQFAPDYHVTAPIWHWGPMYKRIVEDYQRGTPKAFADIWGTMADKMVDLSPTNPKVALPPGISKLVKRRKIEIIQGDFEPFTGPIRDVNGKIRLPEAKKISYEELRKMDWYVEGVIAPR